MTHTGIRTAAIAVAAAAVLTSLTGCGSDGGDGKTLTYWSMWTENEPQAAVLKSAIKDFTKDTGIKVNVQWQGRTVMEKLAPTLTTGKVPDLVDQSDDKLYPTLVQSGRAKDLSGVFDKPATGEKGKLSSKLKMSYLGYLRKQPDGGNKWLVPYEVTSVNLWYNAADKDVKPPRTWDELLDVCAKLKSKGRACVSADGDQPVYIIWWLDYLADRIGGDGVMKKAITDKSGKGWDDPAVKEAAEKIRELVDKGYLLKGYDASKYPEQQNRWAQGKAAFNLNGSWLPTETKKFAKEGFDYKAAPFPSAVPDKGGKRNATDVRLFGFAVPKQAKNASAAEKFISYFLAKKRLSGIAAKAGNITPRPDIEAPAILQDVKEQVESTPSREQLPGSVTSYTDKALYPAYKDLFFGKADADRFVAEVKKLHTSYVKAQR
ncbi:MULTISPECIES: extracellular solute-binding protein [unclassified Streptomyces]|uniref:ABC transporter substrate-binding protein n=1 Tax=unclassified Streptomyces TaxID=2593676 RepID=UPI002DDA3F5B|nr:MULTISPECIES: extracellular solute-binding protein [unclassified Streptomyces]WSB80255.1 extracellular solute-binding protein [Streptomyces sp. NBC_01775]WSS11535.1 extracellular solute-binding protein [Streptomyces sp. NBC_01186]WSS40250.1 extracellular solute-binding protein [Streptomyces sp. NBC_01187]